MVPFWGRFSLRTARIVVAVLALAWCAFSHTQPAAWSLAVSYALFSLVVLLASKFDVAPRSIIALAGDTAFLLFAEWLLPTDAFLALATAYVVLAAALMHPLKRLLTVAVAIVVCSIPVAFYGWKMGNARFWWIVAEVGAGISFAYYKRYLERRMSHTLRHNVMIRSRSENAREAERERIAADFHDGPLQNFISFQMRLEIIRKLLLRDTNAATSELHQLQDLCRHQVAELRGFVRSMRPVDDGISLSASLSRMVEQFQRDTGIVATFSSSEFADPAQTEVSLEVLQIVRETLSNIHRHSGASRVAISLGKQGDKLELKAEDNGGGFPFSGTFTLDELEMMRMGPVSIKRRVKLLGGELQLDSWPGKGSSLEIRVPL